jgi:hypothetical protein
VEKYLMSWKSLVTAGLLCFVASPVFAQPGLTVSDGVESGGNLLWTVAVQPDVESPLAFELGFRAVDGNFVDIVPNPETPTPGSSPIEYLDNPGHSIFGWEALDNTANDQPTGIQIGTGDDADEAFVAMGSNILTPGSYDILTITTDLSVSSLEWGGIFQNDGTMGTAGTDFLTGLIAQDDSGGASTNFYGFAGSASGGGDGITGDYDATGQVAQGDLDLVLLNWGKTVPPDTLPAEWVNQRPTGLIGQAALDPELLNWGNTSGSGAVLGAASTVPEPATIALFGLAFVAVAGLKRRRVN